MSLEFFGNIRHRQPYWCNRFGALILGLFFTLIAAPSVEAFDGIHSREALPSCGSQQFTVSPIDLRYLSSIEPLGFVAPPGHTIPTDHVYFFPSSVSGTPHPIRAPGDIYILEVTGPRNLNASGDFKISFALCRDVFGFYIHMGSVSEALSDAFSNIPCESNWGSGHGDSCTRFSSLFVTAGTIVGTAKKQGPFDLGTYDYRKRLAYANPARHGTEYRDKPRGLYVTCPFDYYSSQEQYKFFQKIERKSKPICGEVMQDVPGTLKGNWYFGNSSFTDPSTWEGQLAFVDDYIDPATAVISVGGTFMSAQTIPFIPKKSGSVNRAFDAVRPSSGFQCYEMSQNQRILLKLLNTDTLHIEFQNRPCGSSYQFSNPTTYHR
jgi:hypothetical protein